MKNEILINTIRTRPRFKVVSGMSAQGFSDKVNLHLKNRSRVLSGYCNTEVGRISVIQDQDKYWAPQLELRIEKNPDNPSQIEIRGIFGPRNSVWTLFMFSYGLGGAILLTTGLYGWIELSLDIGNFWVWTNLIGLILIIGPYVSSFVGKRIARNHVDLLRAFIERVLVEEKVLH